MKKASYILLVFTALFLASCTKEADCFNNAATEDNSETSGAIIDYSEPIKPDFNPSLNNNQDDPNGDDGIRDGDSNDDDDDLEDKRKKSKG